MLTTRETSPWFSLGDAASIRIQHKSADGVIAKDPRNKMNHSKSSPSAVWASKLHQCIACVHILIITQLFKFDLQLMLSAYMKTAHCTDMHTRVRVLSRTHLSNTPTTTTATSHVITNPLDMLTMTWGGVELTSVAFIILITAYLCLF